MSDSFVTPRTVAHQAPLSMGILQENNTGVGCHTLLQGIFPTPGTEPEFKSLTYLALAHWLFTTSTTWDRLPNGANQKCLRQSPKQPPGGRTAPSGVSYLLANVCECLLPCQAGEGERGLGGHMSQTWCPTPGSTFSPRIKGARVSK